MAPEAPVVYRIDANDAIVYVNDAWDRFAEANEGGHLVAKKVLSRPLLPFISDPSTQDLYLVMIAHARAGRPARFTFRCDSPDRRRLLEMQIRSEAPPVVEFQVRTLKIEEREPQRLLKRDVRRTQEMLRACGWCKKMLVGADWIEVEEAARRLKLLESSDLPMITHGICPACEATLV